MTVFKQAIKKLNGYSEVLKLLAKEVSKKGYFDKKDLELMKNFGATVLFDGSTWDMLLEDKHKRINNVR